MILSASTIAGLYRPSRCELRVWLSAHGEPTAEPGAFEQVLVRLGERHEAQHLAELGPYADLRAGDLETRAAHTRNAIRRGDGVLYQPVFMLDTQFGGAPCTIVGVPDFLIRAGDAYLIRDCKLSLHADEDHHPEILLQLQLYAWLFKQTVGQRPAALEVVLGNSSIVPVANDGGRAALATLADLKRTSDDVQPYSPVGWSKCQGCGYRDRCWANAEASEDVALVYGVDQGLARTLRAEGVETIAELLDGFEEPRLAELTRPWGTRMRRVGRDAGRILDQARAMHGKREIHRSPPRVPVSENYVMFDVEGMPPHLDELEKIYLWGVQVFGARPGPYQAAVGGFGPDGDRQGWRDFLALARQMLAEHGDIPFVHWHHYETTKLRAYVDRHGDPDGTAARVQRNCLDLLPITRDAIVLPTPSYSLKVVEQHVGYRRTLDEYGGDWSMAKYIEATESKNAAERQAIMDEILAYNHEDLEATWAVLNWLRDLA